MEPNADLVQIATMTPEQSLLLAMNNAEFVFLSTFSRFVEWLQISLYGKPINSYIKQMPLDLP